MTPRTFVALIAAALFLAGGIALLSPVSIETGSAAMPCGTAVSGDVGKAKAADQETVLKRTLSGGAAMFPKTDYIGDCRSALSTRRAWTVPLTVVGAVALLGAVAVRTRPAAAATDTAGAPSV